MSDMVIYVDKEDLIKAVGKSYKSILDTLCEQSFIKGYKDSIEITVSKDRAINIQTILEFHSAKNVPFNKVTTKFRKESE